MHHTLVSFIVTVFRRLNKATQPKFPSTSTHAQLLATRDDLFLCISLTASFLSSFFFSLFLFSFFLLLFSFPSLYLQLILHWKAVIERHKQQKEKQQSQAKLSSSSSSHTLLSSSSGKRAHAAVDGGSSATSGGS